MNREVKTEEEQDVINKVYANLPNEHCTMLEGLAGLTEKMQRVWDSSCEICGEPDASHDGNYMLLCDKCYSIGRK